MGREKERSMLLGAAVKCCVNMSGVVLSDAKSRRACHINHSVYPRRPGQNRIGVLVRYEIMLVPEFLLPTLLLRHFVTSFACLQLSPLRHDVEGPVWGAWGVVCEAVVVGCRGSCPAGQPLTPCSSPHLLTSSLQIPRPCVPKMSGSRCVTDVARLTREVRLQERLMLRL